MKYITSSVQAKFILAISLTVVVFFTILLLISFTTFEHYSIEKLTVYAFTVLSETDSKINLFLRDIESLAYSLSHYRAIYKINESDMKNIFLSSVHARKEYIRTICLGTKEGKMYAWGFGEGLIDNIPSFPPDYDSRQRPWYQTVNQKRAFILSKPYIHAGTNTLGITGAVPVYNEKSEFVGVLGIDIIPQGLNRIVHNLNVQGGSRVILLDSNYGILANQPDSMEDNPLYREDFSFQGKIIGENGTFTEIINNQKMFVSYTKNKATGWILLVTLPYHEIMKFSNDTMDVIFLTDLVLIFILIVVVTILIRRIVTGHLSNLISVMKRISSGELDARFPISGNDEFATMGKLFNQLAELREKYTYKMKEEVRKRTEAISKLQQDNIRLRVLEEKERIFRNLHDSLGARLTNIFISNHVARSVVPADNKFLVNMLTRVEKNAELAISDLKEIIFDHGGKRSIIDFAGFLMINIKNRLDLKKIVLRYKIKHKEIINSMTVNIKMELENILGELVTNVLKHSDASAVIIDIRATENRLVISFRDDGVGYDKEKKLAERKGFGLSGILERIEKLDGGIKIKTSRNSGTRYIINLPVRILGND